MRLLAVLMALAISPAACAAEINHGSVAGGIQGRVTVGPLCPVEVAGSPCPDAPLAVTITVRRPNGDLVLDTDTGADGRFRIQLSPGTYTIEAEPLRPDGVARMLPVDPVSVRPGAYSTVPISFDSGIR
jgi:hypothetical protein